MAAKRFLKNEFLIKVSILLRGIKVFSTDTLVYPGKTSTTEIHFRVLLWEKRSARRFGRLAEECSRRVLGGEHCVASSHRRRRALRLGLGSWLRGRGGVEGKGEFLVAHQRRHRSQCRRCNQVCGGGERSFG